MLPIYVVSLKRDSKRRTIISEKMHALGLQFEFIDAVEGRLLPIETLDKVRYNSVGIIQTRGYIPTPGEVGCAFSHLLIYEKIQNDIHEWTCILEDDVILDERFAEFCQDFPNKEAILKPDTLYLLGGQNGLEHPLLFKSYVRKMIIGGQTFTKTIESEAYIYRTCCYLMSRTMAKSLMEFSKKHFFIADDWNFLSQQKMIKQIYLADFVDHPLDLSDSAIERERQASLQSVEHPTAKEDSFFVKVKNFTRWKIHVLKIKIKQYL